MREDIQCTVGNKKIHIQEEHIWEEEKASTPVEMSKMYSAILYCAVSHDRSVVTVGLLFGNIPVISLPDLNDPIS
jgi:hypothetical protein